MLFQNQQLSAIPSIHDPIICRTMFSCFFSVPPPSPPPHHHQKKEKITAASHEPMFSDMMQTCMHSQVSSEKSFYLLNSLRCDQIKTSRVRLNGLAQFRVQIPKGSLVTHEEVVWLSPRSCLSLNSRLCSENKFPAGCRRTSSSSPG
jgi:hypothetical protein